MKKREDNFGLSRRESNDRELREADDVPSALFRSFISALDGHPDRFAVPHSLSAMACTSSTDLGGSQQSLQVFHEHGEDVMSAKQTQLLTPQLTYIGTKMFGPGRLSRLWNKFSGTKLYAFISINFHLGTNCMRKGDINRASKPRILRS